MCSLLGVAGPGIIKQDLHVLKQLGMISMLRGIDGTGFYQVNIDKDKIKSSILVKSELDAAFFIRDLEDRKHKLLDDINVDMIMGHTRWATIGEVNAKNSHPFEFDNIVAAHNGTLKEWKYHSKKKTDSELMFEEVNKTNLKDTLSALDEQSAFAVTVFDKKTCKLTFSRNHHRTLSFALLDDRDVLFWHSEMGALKYILGRNGIKAQAVSFDINKLYTVHPEEIRAKELAMWEIVDNPRQEKPWISKFFGDNSTSANSNIKDSGWEQEKPKVNIKKIHTPRKLTEECDECKRVMYPIDVHQGLNVKDKYLCRQCIQKNPEHDMIKKVLH